MYRVMIVDDEPWSIYGLEKLIDWESQGFHIKATATDGLSALGQIKELKPHLLISDIRMPGLDGLELTRELKKTSPGTAIILVTGYSDFAYAQEALRQGVFDYLGKQVKKVELLHALERVKTHLQKASSTDWDLYFSLFDEDNNIPVKSIAKYMGFSESSRCCVVSALCDSIPDIPMIGQPITAAGYTQLHFRTGVKKETALLCFDENSRPGSLTEAAQITNARAGTSQISSLDVSFSELLR